LIRELSCWYVCGVQKLNRAKRVNLCEEKRFIINLSRMRAAKKLTKMFGTVDRPGLPASACSNCRFRTCSRYSHKFIHMLGSRCFLGLVEALSHHCLSRRCRTGSGFMDAYWVMKHLLSPLGSDEESVAMIIES
jgi:hypothetical protein